LVTTAVERRRNDRACRQANSLAGTADFVSTMPALLLWLFLANPLMMDVDHVADGVVTAVDENDVPTNGHIAVMRRNRREPMAKLGRG
jgi:hypothetical protein